MKKKCLMVVAGFMLVLTLSSLSGCAQPVTMDGIFQSQQEGIWVTGIGKVTVVPDIANISLGIDSQEASVATAQVKATETMNQIMGVLTDHGVAKKDILSGLNEAISTRSFNLLKRVGIQKDFAITGGISKNSGMVAKIAEKVGLEPMLCEDPQLVGALGAALFARDKYNQINAKN